MRLPAYDACMFSRFVALAFAGILASSPTVNVSIITDRGVLFVNASVNGVGPLLFIFDPGAGDLITTYAADRIGGKPVREIGIGDASVRGVFPVLSGDPEQLDPKHDLAQGAIAGSLGPAFLQQYAIRIDYAKAAITLTPFGTFVPEQAAEQLPVNIDSYGMPTVTAAVDGITGRFEIDVRAPTSMLFSPFVRQHHVLDEQPHSIDLGRYVVRDAVLRLSRASAGKFASAEVAGLIGNNVLSKFVLTFDYHRHVLLLER